MAAPRPHSSLQSVLFTAQSALMELPPPFGDEPRLLVAAASALLLLLLLLLCCCRSGEPPRPPGEKYRSPVLGDVEANAVASGTLPTRVIEAATAGDTATIGSWLADDRCVVDACAASDGCTALHAAARAGHVPIIRMLLEAGADALAVDTAQRTPLHHVAVAGHGICVKALLDAGSDPEGADADGKTPMDLAAEAKHMGCLRMMRLWQDRKMVTGGGFRRYARPSPPAQRPERA